MSGHGKRDGHGDAQGVGHEHPHGREHRDRHGNPEDLTAYLARLEDPARVE